MLELINRRNALFNQMKPNSIAIIFSGVSKISSEDEYLPFCINKNFYYVTNITQEDSILVMVKGFSENRNYLFVQEYSELKEKWTGKRLTFDQAKAISGIDNIYSLNALESTLKLILDPINGQLGRIENVYLDLSPEIKVAHQTSTIEYSKKLLEKYPNVKIENVYPLFVELRMIKSSLEIENIVKAINATNSAIMSVVSNMRAGQKEYEVADAFEYHGKCNQRRPLAFSSIVANGKNATCLHYPTQTDTLKDGDLLQFDVGLRNELYCADISRVYPVNGRFTQLQKTIYECVLRCNKAVITYAKPGLTLKDLQDYATEFLKAECIKNNLMSKTDDIRKYYYHNVSHHLGLDTHDISFRDKPLEVGNVITVEPGLYFDKFGIGIRIEDDILIKEGRNEVLSYGVKKEIKDIEDLFVIKG